MGKRVYDVAIIGGGPAGAVTGAYLARGGLNCVILEQARFPRQHVGESLVPSVNRIFDDLNLFEEIEALQFPKKFGAAWTSADKAPIYQTDWKGLVDGDTGGDVDVRFEERQQQGVDLPYTFHVDRAKFDHMLLNKAEELGCRVHQEARVSDINFTEGEDPRLTYLHERVSQKIQVGMVVDASGRSTLLGNQLDIKIKDPNFDQVAFHTWFEGYDRRALARHQDQIDYIFIHFLPMQNTWVWAIPITDTITSIGVVSQKETYKSRKGSKEDFFWECLGSRPEFLEVLKAAKQMHPIRGEGDYSYGMKQICGDRFILVGDAARFVDPIFSSGVSIALTSAKLAGENILAAFKENRLERDSFCGFERTIRNGCRNWHSFISLYYRLNVLFTYFLKDKRYRIDVLKLLQGDLYDEEEPEVLKLMRQKVEDVESDPKHPWHAYLGSISLQPLEPAF